MDHHGQQQSHGIHYDVATVVIGSVAAYLLVRRARPLVRLLRRAGGLVPFLWGFLATRRRNSRSGEDGERLPCSA